MECSVHTSLSGSCTAVRFDLGALTRDYGTGGLHHLWDLSASLPSSENPEQDRASIRSTRTSVKSTPMQVLEKLPSPSAWRLLADSSNRAPQYSLPRMIPSIYCCKDRSLQSAADAACKSKGKFWTITQRRVRNWKWTTKFWQYKIWFRISLCKALASCHNGDLE